MEDRCIVEALKWAEETTASAAERVKVRVAQELSSEAEAVLPLPQGEHRMLLIPDEKLSLLSAAGQAEPGSPRQRIG